MTRAQQTIALGVALLAVYASLLFEVIPVSAKVQEEIVPVLPFWGLVSFGAYLLFWLGHGVFTFNDVPQAHEELMGEIAQAKKELRELGVDTE